MSSGFCEVRAGGHESLGQNLGLLPPNSKRSQTSEREAPFQSLYRAQGTHASHSDLEKPARRAFPRDPVPSSGSRGHL